MVAALAAAASMLAGCSSALTVRGDVVRPARVPVRAFPRILVVSDGTPEGETVADAVARHLASGRSRVQRLPPAEVTARRDADRIPRATVVVRTAVELVRRDRPEWARRRELDCGPLGCIESQRPYVRDVPVLTGRLTVTVADGPSGRSLQREAVEEQQSGVDLLGMRLRVLERLSERARELVDQRTERVVVELHPVEHPAVRAALALIREGEWTAGRRRLERFTESEAFAALPVDRRALVLYDLGQSLRFDTSLPPDQRFDRAAQALRAAVRLVPEPRYANALGELRSHRRSRAMVREQQEAMAHNFRLGQPGPEVPEPPAHYEPR